ncbi:MAG TPA: hypothetical protein VFP23_04545 [Solirubrobacterales bacterium]|nr:hypothetical protein [Solirubrobacterales bacterium]
MATKNPTGGERVASVDLPVEHIAILRDRLASWLEGLRDDLRFPERLESPEEARRESQVYERLLVGLTSGEIALPDEAARVTIEAAAEAYDRESNYAEITASHDALRGLLSLLEGDEGCSASPVLADSFR